MACDLVSEILGNECIGDSREKINDNFSALETAVCTLSTNTISVVDTTTIDLDYTSSSRIISGAVRTNSINDTHIQNNSITTDKIAPDTVRYSQLASWQSLSGTSLSAEALTQRVAKAWAVIEQPSDNTYSIMLPSFNISSITAPSPGTGSDARSLRIYFTSPISGYKCAVTSETYGTVYLGRNGTTEDSDVMTNPNYIDVFWVEGNLMSDPHYMTIAIFA